jgi:predicted amidohydrolase
MSTLSVALISEVFYQADGKERLHARLAEAKERGAELALLPELALNPWSPATKTAREEETEPPEGPRFRMLQAAARAAGIGVVGGVIERDASGTRHSQGLVFDALGTLRGSYAKCHLPEEEGFWETSHYQPGQHPPAVIAGFGMGFGIQICSDVNRPEGSHLLGALGAQAVLNPRATEAATYQRWRTVFVANALTSCLYVLSVNRPGPEQGVLLGGPSIAVAPDGEILLETTGRLALAHLDSARVEQSRLQYPGYLPVRADLYADAWARVAQRGNRLRSGLTTERIPVIPS